MAWISGIKSSQERKGGLNAKWSVLTSSFSSFKTVTAFQSVRFQKAIVPVSDTDTHVWENVLQHRGIAVTAKMSNTHRGHRAVAWSSSAATLQLCKGKWQLLLPRNAWCWKSYRNLLSCNLMFSQSGTVETLSFGLFIKDKHLVGKTGRQNTNLCLFSIY